jgi:SAM-dependent methyltransferase
MERDVRSFNREAWNRQVERGNPWTRPVGSDVIAAARRGEWSVVLTEQKPVPREWFGDIAGRDVLCLASGGGQQGPVLAAAGARVTVYDNSPRQLSRDREVAARDGLEIRTVEGDMRDLSAFEDASFDLVFHPVSNCFVPEVRPVWREAFRVLRPGGALLVGFVKPETYLFDDAAADVGEMRVRFRVPYSDLEGLTPDELRAKAERGDPLEFSHTLEQQIGGQLEAGFLLAGLYEDAHAHYVIGKWFPSYVATRAVKPPLKATRG